MVTIVVGSTIPVGAQLTASAPFDGGRMAAGKLLFLENNVYNPPDPPISGVEELTAQHDLSAMAAYRDGLFLNIFVESTTSFLN